MLDQQNPPATGAEIETDRARPTTTTAAHHRIDGLDVLVESRDDPETLAHKMRSVTAIGDFRLTMISNLDTVANPDDLDHRDDISRWLCRFAFTCDAVEAEREVPWLLSVIGEHMRWIHVEKLERGTDPLTGAHPTHEMAAP